MLENDRTIYEKYFLFLMYNSVCGILQSGNDTLEELKITLQFSFIYILSVIKLAMSFKILKEIRLAGGASHADCVCEGVLPIVNTNLCVSRGP